MDMTTEQLAERFAAICEGQDAVSVVDVSLNVAMTALRQLPKELRMSGAETLRSMATYIESFGDTPHH